MKPLNVLLIAHGHPELQKGGAEVATWNLHRALLAHGHRSTFLARAAPGSHGGSSFSSRHGDTELLVHTGMVDSFDFRSANLDIATLGFADFLRRLRPDVIHFQHYVQLGLEWIHVARRTCPDATIVLTLHEYLALCASDGQMLKFGTKELCYRSDPDDCARCIPGRSAADFFLRREFVRAAFAHVDHFISPSEFLRDRYVAWGLPADRIEVIENVHPAYERQPPRPLAAGERRARFAYFGQANAYKGLDVALSALALLPKALRREIHLDIHSANLENQDASVRERIASLLADCKGSATFHGPYEPRELPRLMARTDWVLVPSIWWENSPMVIQETFGHGRPVLCADIGGMAEKVRHGVDGWHFPARSAVGLADAMRTLVEDEGIWDTVREGITTAESEEVIVSSHVRMYGARRTSEV